MAGETTDGDKEWLVKYGLMEGEITWEDEELDTATTNNSSCPSTDPAIVTADRVYGPNSVEQIITLEHRLDRPGDEKTFSGDTLTKATC